MLVVAEVQETLQKAQAEMAAVEMAVRAGLQRLHLEQLTLAVVAAAQAEMVGRALVVQAAQA
jgi:hypothetical protein